MFKYHNLLFEALQSEYSSEQIAHLQAKPFWNLHRRIVKIIWLEEVKEYHELMGLVVIECTGRYASYLASGT